MKDLPGKVAQAKKVFQPAEGSCTFSLCGQIVTDHNSSNSLPQGILTLKSSSDTWEFLQAGEWWLCMTIPRLDSGSGS